MGGVSVAPRVAGRIACVRVAPVVAPERYLMMSPVERAALAPRIGALSRRIELLIIRSIFPEMTADSVPIIFELDHDPGEDRKSVVSGKSVSVSLEHGGARILKKK